ncbi:MBL fold metallo-hydrolase [Halovenus sp. WSH3]|uniref:MBL fold metallo-hydrolase n=1 Tax=Halovenus carboxidivorans TaxID=2692199 RepID=A0A6B0T2P3_9EURY|nr:MBL fold metallo-hydrolase [Halovenus carboxidivorans]MXR50506.1 MBL fold metallo-hydrolase [Halovenus carboxidivorans]
MCRQLREHVWWIDLSGVNAYLVDDDGTWTLIDAGMPWHHEEIQQAVAEVAGSIAAVDRVLLTHYDLDHVGALARLDGLDAPIYVGRADYPFLVGQHKPPLNNHKGAFQRAVGWLVDSPDGPVETIEDGDQIGSFTAHHAPGHTPGHTVYASETLSTGILGDLVREDDGELVPSPYVISYDTDDVRDSLRALPDELPAFEAACQGHGVPFREGGYDRLRECAAGY